MICATCEGTGIITSWDEPELGHKVPEQGLCPDCDGPAIICPDCQGIARGAFAAMLGLECPTCEGAGALSITTELETP